MMSSSYERARAAWPEILLEPEVFAKHMAEVGGDERHAEDVYLAYACAAGMPAALRELERRYLSEVPFYLSRIDPSPAIADEIKQQLREHLLVASPGKRPRIAEYSGRGALGGWLRVIAVRSLRRMQGRAREHASSDDAITAQLVATGPDPETALLKAKHGADLAQAIRAAVVALSPRDRGLLKMHVLDGLTIDELCVIHGVHRATVARWIARLRQQLLEDAMRSLRERLALDTSEGDSLCNAVRSQLEVSWAGLLDEE
jgi:RNA polymerase sigma-70 factor (ECF subfamily)